MSICSYDSKRIIPCPFITVVKNYIRSNNGEIQGATYTINVNGTIVAHKGSPTSSGTFHTIGGYPVDEAISDSSKLKAILRKQDALRDLFSVEGRSFEIQSLDGSQPLKCNPRIVGPIQFQEGQWYNTCAYSLTLEADKLYPMEEDEFTYLVSDVQESWSIDTDDNLAEGVDLPRTYRLSHTVSAVGKRFYDETGALTNEAWQNAREFVLPRLGIDSSLLSSSGIKDLPSFYSGFNHVRSENVDELGGAYTITETWILASGTALEDFTIETNRSIEDGLTRVNIEGTITGLEQRNGNLQLTTNKYDNAVTKFTIASGLALTRAQLYSGHTLNITPLVTRIGRNPITGTINYGFEFDNRPSNIISGALSEVISIVDNFDEQSIAIVPVLGRAAGPVLQDLGTKREQSRQLTVELVMERPSFGNNTQSEIQAALFSSRPTIQVSSIINAANPANNGFSTSYLVSNQETWDAKNGRYSRNMTWIYE